MITTDQRDAVRVAHFQCQQQKEGFHRVVPTVDKVTQKKIVFVGTLATDFKEFYEIIKLPMDVSANLDRRGFRETK